KDSTPFSVALSALQDQIGYTFESDGLLRRAMTHSSFSGENNKALSVLGASIVETSASLSLLTLNIDISAMDLSRSVSETSKVEGSCTVDGTRLGLQKILRVSRNTNSSSPPVICGAFRAIFGAISIDSGSVDRATKIFLRVH
ncbi:hypothetical protein M569_11933, partial [Genlisea aurea]